MLEEPPATATRRPRWVYLLLIAYVVALALIAFWPVPVDSGAVGLLDRIESRFPWVTYGRIEFSANVLLFVPLGWLLSILLPRSRYLVLPIGLLTTITIETVQASLLPRRTYDVSDLIANTAGVCIGLILAAIPWQRTQASANTTEPRSTSSVASSR